MYPDELRQPRQLREGRDSPNPACRGAAYGATEGTDEVGQNLVGDADWREGKVELLRHLDSAQVALHNERETVRSLQEELTQLRKQLTTLRNSRTMQAGRLISGPYQAVQKYQSSAKRWLRRIFLGEVRESRIGAGKFNPSVVRTEETGPVRVRNAVRQRGGVMKRELGATWSTKTKKTTLDQKLNEAWYQRGSITDARALLVENAEQIDQLSERGKVLRDRIEGAYRLLNGALTMPPRAQGCAYLPEPDRVMYTVHSTPIFNSNGYSTRTRGIAKGIRQAGGDIVVVARTGYPWDSKADTKKPAETRHVEEMDGVSYVHLPGGNLNRQALDHYILKAADSFVREARLLRPSVIQSASNHRTALPALIAARRVGVPFVYEVRGLWEITQLAAQPDFKDTERFRVMKNLETLVAQEADVVLAITQQVAEELMRRGVDRERIAVVPNAVDPRVFLPLPKDKAFGEGKGLDIDLPTIGFAGSMVEYEGLDTLLDASARLSEKGIEHQIVLAGGGSAESALKEQTSSLGLNNVHFLGRLPQDDIPRLMSVIDVVVCPRHSMEITELVSPLKPLEAFAASKATVLSDVAPNVALAGQDSSRALTFRAGDSNELTHRLQRLISDPELRADLGRAARLWTIRTRNWRTVGETVLEQVKDAKNSDGTMLTDGHQLKQLRVGVIADEFTASALNGSFAVESIRRDDWREQIDSTDFDLIFVESAWYGNNGEWHRGIGHYSDEESADLRELLKTAGKLEIPTVFWNKEDPVHFSRFAPNAALFDHVATTDANMIDKYLQFPGNKNKTVSALPFFAQPKIHNPLPVDTGYRNTVAYAGTYYGDRYKERSENLEKLLSAAAPYGLDIYDRQAANPESPYKFPERYQSSTRGSLPYDHVVESYKTHLAHLNVNSVLDSPTMFSRRVVEIPACGGVVLSSAARGVLETLGSTIAASDDPADYRAFLHEWSTEPLRRIDEIWLQMRTVYRSHTADTALTILCRTMGFQIVGPTRPSYGVSVVHLDAETAGLLASQSIRPAVVSSRTSEESARQALEGAGIELVSDLSARLELIDYVGKLERIIPRTYFEDMLLPCVFGEWDFVRSLGEDEVNGASEIARPLTTELPKSGLVRAPLVNINTTAGVYEGLAVRPPSPVKFDGGIEDGEPPLEDGTLPVGTRVLVAGHDLKFATSIIEKMEAQGLQVDIDQWKGHNQHDEEQSRRKLEHAQIVFCEWGLGNAVWYSRYLRDDQKLIVRVHSQEIFLPYLKQINHARVRRFLFVGELIRKAAVATHGIPDVKTVVIPNPVDSETLHRSKSEQAAFGIGFVGMIPRSKRIDRALDLLEELQRHDNRYHLRIKGKTPEDYPWMKNRPQELEYYDKQFNRIKMLNRRTPGSVIFDGFGPDMADWYSKVGIVVSVSEFESFHLTVADGAASGAFPVSLDWPGADLIYPDSWLFSTVAEMASAILTRDRNNQPYINYVTENFEKKKVLGQILRQLQ